MSVIKGFTSTFHTIKAEYNSATQYLKQIYATVRELGAGQVGLMMSPMWLSTVSSGNTIDASGSTKRILAIAGHGHSAGQVIRFTTGPNTGIEVQIMDASEANSVLLGQELPEDPTGSNVYTLLRPMTPTLSPTGNLQIVNSGTGVVDFLDGGSIAPTGGNVIPRSSNNALQVVASLAAAVTKIQVVSDVGEFINIYSDAAKTNLIAHLPLTPDEIVDVEIPAGTSIYIGAAKDADIDDANSIISMNFIG